MQHQLFKKKHQLFIWVVPHFVFIILFSFVYTVAPLFQLHLFLLVESLNKLFRILNCCFWSFSWNSNRVLKPELFPLRYFLRTWIFSTTCNEEVVSYPVTVWIWGNCCNFSFEISFSFLNIDTFCTLSFHYLLLIDFTKSMSKDHQNKNIRAFWTNYYMPFAIMHGKSF